MVEQRGELEVDVAAFQKVGTPQARLLIERRRLVITASPARSHRSE